MEYAVGDVVYWCKNVDIRSGRAPEEYKIIDIKEDQRLPIFLKNLFSGSINRANDVNLEFVRHDGQSQLTTADMAYDFLNEAVA